MVEPADSPWVLRNLGNLWREKEQGGKDEIESHMFPPLLFSSLFYGHHIHTSVPKKSSRVKRAFHRISKSLSDPCLIFTQSSTRRHPQTMCSPSLLDDSKSQCPFEEGIVFAFRAQWLLTSRCKFATISTRLARICPRLNDAAHKICPNHPYHEASLTLLGTAASGPSQSSRRIFKDSGRGSNSRSSVASRLGFCVGNYGAPAVCKISSMASRPRQYGNSSTRSNIQDKICPTKWCYLPRKVSNKTKNIGFNPTVTDTSFALRKDMVKDNASL
jgi:hypothetical protein